MQTTESAGFPASRASRAVRGILGWRSVFLVLLAVPALGPVGVILAQSFDTSGLGEPFRFGVGAWRAVLGAPETLSTFTTSLLLTVRVPAGLAIGFAIAWAVVRLRVPGHQVFEYLCWFAYFLPTVPMVSGWVLLMDRDFGLLNAAVEGLGLPAPFDIRSPGGIVWVHLSLQTVPLLTILTIPALRLLDRTPEDAALVAGARPARVLGRVILPLVAPAILLAGLASWIKALEAFEVEQLLGERVASFVVSTRIYGMVSSEPPRMAEAMALSMIFLLLLLGLGLLYSRALRWRGQGAANRGEGSGGARPSYGTLLRRSVSVAVGLYLAITILLPFGMLVMGSFMKLFGFFALDQVWTTSNWSRVLGSASFGASLRATLTLGLATALPGALLFGLIAAGMTRLRGPQAAAAAVLVWLPWAFPGIILGVAILEVSLTFPGMRMLHGTIAPLILGLLIRDLPIGVHVMRNALTETDSTMADAARISGAGWLRTFLRISLPLQMPALTLVFLILFAGAIRDVGTIILVAPPGFQTLSLQTFNYISNSQFEMATVLGTIVALLALAISVLAHLLGRRLGSVRSAVGTRA